MIQSASQNNNLIIGTGLITAETIASELRQRLANRATEFRGLTDQEIIFRARNILAEFEPLIAEALLATDLAAWISGFDRVAKELPTWTVQSFSRFDSGLPPIYAPTTFDVPDDPVIKFPLIDRARESLMERKILTPDEYKAATAEARNRSFTVAADMSNDAMETIRDTLAENIREGTSLKGFRKALGERLDTSKIGPAHIETIYRTNVQAAFADGHETIASNPIVASLFPYQAYHAIHDGRVDPEHLALESYGLNGTNVYRRDDPMWDWFTPPWRYNCRCGVNLLTIESAARKGVREAMEWLRTSRPPEKPEWRLGFIPFRPKNGFGGARRKAMAA